LEKVDNLAPTSSFAMNFAEWLTSEGFSYHLAHEEHRHSFDLLDKPGVQVICIDLAFYQTPDNDPPVADQPPGNLTTCSPILLHEDVWQRHPNIVRSRIRAQLGVSQRIAARWTKIERLDKPTADAFLEANHLNGSPKARYRFGLFLPARYFPRCLTADFQANPIEEKLLVAVATFAAPRTFDKDGVAHKSGELIRFASLLNTTVVGGVSKLVDHFAAQYQTDDVMTYVDREWSNGTSFASSGFEVADYKPPTSFVVDRITYDRYALHRIDNKLLYGLADRLVKVSNAGSTKLLRRYTQKTDLQPPPKSARPSSPSLPPYDVIFVVGPTASGKTALAVRLAYEIGGEIISLDSRQIFRGMDLGTGKDLHEYQIDDRPIPYHLIDIEDPGTPYSVHHFTRDFQIVYARLREQGKPIIACGGSGLYIESVLNVLTQAKASVSPPSLLIIGLHPPTAVRRERIFKRLQSRLKAGLVEEVKRLREEGVAESTLIHYGLEYKYITLFLQGTLTYKEMVVSLGNEIVRFSKRQMTFLKKIERSGYVISWLK
jgi:tRNA dimethylallyltransferase